MKIVAFETAKLAKEAGYDESCDCFYGTNGDLFSNIDDYGFGIIPNFDCWAPYQAELLDWLRNEKKIHVIVDIAYNKVLKACIYCGKTIDTSTGFLNLYIDKFSYTYEDAVENVLQNILMYLINQYN